MSDPNAENIIFNITKGNTTQTSSTSRYFQIRNQNIIDKIEDYYVRVLEAKIPITEVPFFIMKDNKYSVTINNQRVYLIAPTNTSPEFNGYIYYFQQFLDSLNQALYVAHNANGYTLASPPYIYYDYVDEYLKIIIDYQYFTLNGGGAVEIFFNNYLLYKLPGFMNIYNEFAVNGQDYQIVYDIYATNYFSAGISDSVNYPCVIITSQDKYVSDLLEFSSVLITTQAIPINDQPVTSENGVNKTLRILASIPLGFNNITKTRYLNYEQIYPKWLKTTAYGALRIIDVELYLISDDFSTRPMSLLPSENLSMRIEFVKRNQVENYKQNS